MKTKSKNPLKRRKPTVLKQVTTFKLPALYYHQHFQHFLPRRLCQLIKHTTKPHQGDISLEYVSRLPPEKPIEKPIQIELGALNNVVSYDKQICAEERINSVAPASGGNEKRRGVSVPFPMKLYQILSNASKEGFDDIISWQPHGRCFLVRKPKKFTEEILPRYFRQSQYASFQRQLNLYGFRRVSYGRDKNGYYHENFLRGKHVLCQHIVRQRVKGTSVRSDIVEEPDFYRMIPLGKLNKIG